MARLDNGADYNIFDHSSEAKTSRTLFNLSYLHTFNADFGELRPFYLQETIPTDKFTISNDILIRVQPMEVPIMSRIRVYTHYYYMRNSQAWAKWNYFVTRGRSGQYDTPFPQFKMTEQPNFKFLDPDDNKWYGQFTEDSLANALGIPIMQYYYKEGQGGAEDSYIEKPQTGDEGYAQIINEGNVAVNFNIIPFFMYQRIYRDYYMNKNLNQDDKIWFPDDDNEFMLGHAYQRSDDTNNYRYLPTANPSEQTVAGKSEGAKREYSLFTLRYRNWRDDYFTSAMPWPQRGNPINLDLVETAEATVPKQYVQTGTGGGRVLTGNMYENGNQYIYTQPIWHNDTGNSDFWVGAIKAEPTPTVEGTTTPWSKGTGWMPTSYQTALTESPQAAFRATGSNGDLYAEWTNDTTKNGSLAAEALHTAATTIQVPISLALTMEKLRYLSIMQTWQERNGRTDGDYNSMIKQHFGYNPHQPDNTPIYIGGTVQDIVITEILQQSATDEQAGTALGDGAGHGISASQGYVGTFECPDYGWIMGIMSIVPDVTYTEGIDRELTRETYADCYYPEFNGLGPQGILKKEIKVGSNPTENDSVWAYQERYQEMKHRRNRVSGAMANKHDQYFKSWTMARFFGATRPTFSQTFVSTKGTVRHDAFTMYEETPFTVQVANRIRAVRPIPYKSRPAGLVG